MGKKKELKSKVRALEAQLAESRKEPIGATEQPRVGDGSGDAALAIGEHAFYAGFEAGVKWGRQYYVGEHPAPMEQICAEEWDNYEPSEDIKGMS